MDGALARVFIACDDAEVVFARCASNANANANANAAIERSIARRRAFARAVGTRVDVVVVDARSIVDASDVDDARASVGDDFTAVDIAFDDVRERDERERSRESRRGATTREATTTREASSRRRIAVELNGEKVANARVIVCDVTRETCDERAFEGLRADGVVRALRALTRDVANETKAGERGTTRRDGRRPWLARAVVFACDVVLQLVSWKCVPSLGTEARWGGGITRRDAREVFASAGVLRQRLMFIRSILVDPVDWGTFDSLRRRRAVARVLQLAFDLALGAYVTLALSRFDVRETLRRRVVLGGSSTVFSGSFLLGTDVIERVARWISRGDPLGVKLHVPLAKMLGSVAVDFIHLLAVTANEPAVVNFLTNWFYILLRCGGMFGASMMFAVLADIMTMVTVHIAALHVYSSLLITAQLRIIRVLYRRFINPKKSATTFKLADEVRARTVEEVVIGTLTLPPLLLLFPTVFFYYASFLCIHAATVFARLMLVFIASTLLNFPTDLVLVRLWKPQAFASGVRMGKKEIHGVQFVSLSLVPKSMAAVLAPFANECASWLSGVFLAVLRALATCGRFPVTLVPFTLDAC